MNSTIADTIDFRVPNHCFFYQNITDTAWQISDFVFANSLTIKQFCGEFYE